MNKSQELLSLVCEGEIFQKDGLVFTASRMEDGSVSGVLTFSGKAFHGKFLENDYGIDWKFDNKLPDSIITSDAFIDLAIEVVSHFDT